MSDKAELLMRSSDRLPTWEDYRWSGGKSCWQTESGAAQ